MGEDGRMVYFARQSACPGQGASRRLSGRGFSLVELMVAVSISAILLALAAPSMQRFLTSRGVLSQADELAGAFRLARSQALKLSAHVSVCASADTTAESPTCSTAGVWNSGWIIFLDYDGNGEMSGADRLLKVQSPLGAINGISGGGTLVVTFAPNGIATTGEASFSVQPKLETSDSYYDATLRKVCLASVGRVNIVTGAESCP